MMKLSVNPDWFLFRPSGFFTDKSLWRNNDFIHDSQKQQDQLAHVQVKLESRSVEKVKGSTLAIRQQLLRGWPDDDS